MEALEHLMKRKTVIIITHHLSIVQRAEQIVVLADGRIAQRGRHRELVEAEGLYRQLFEDSRYRHEKRSVPERG